MHPKAVRNVGLTAVLLACSLWLGCSACSTRQDPDVLRQKTAETTANLKSDAKAIGEGVRQGLSSDEPIDINHASKERIAKLPGMDTTVADQVIAARPYRSTRELVARRIISQEEYGRIRDRITAR